MTTTARPCSTVTLPRPVIAALGGAASALLRGASAVEAIYLAALAAAAATALLAFAPGLRRLIEIAALSLTVVALLPVVTELWLALSVVLGGALTHLIHGGAAHRLPLRLRLVSRREALCEMPADHVWRRLVPGAGHPDDYWTGSLVDYEGDPDDEMTVYMRFRDQGGLFREATVSFVDLTPGRSARWLIDDERAPVGEHCEMSVRLTEEAEFRTRISSELTYRNLPLGRALDLMLDGCGRDSWRGLAQTESHRARVALDPEDRAGEVAAEA